MFDLINPSRIFHWIEKLINFINSIFLKSNCVYGFYHCLGDLYVLIREANLFSEGTLPHGYEFFDKNIKFT